jgi:hypothetical protein
MGITEDRVRMIVLESMLIGLRARQVVAVDYLFNEDLRIEARLLSVEIKALEECLEGIYNRMDTL